MDLGVHVSLWTPEWESPFLDAIDEAAELGCGCVEIPLMKPRDLPLAEIARRLSRRHLKVYCGTGLGQATDIGSPLDPVREAGIRHLMECVEACAELGGESLGGVIHSPWGMRGSPPAGYSATVASSLAKIAGRAGELGVGLAIECVNRYENSFVNTVAQGLALLREVGRDNVGLHLDTYHMNIEERDMSRAIAEAGKRLKRIHLSENDRGYPGNGSLPWVEIIAAVKKTGYEGPWIVESYVNPSFPCSADVSVWRTIEPDMRSSLRRSLCFLRDLIESGEANPSGVA